MRKFFCFGKDAHEAKKYIGKLGYFRDQRLGDDFLAVLKTADETGFGFGQGSYDVFIPMIESDIINYNLIGKEA